jgi:hypothetical protein
LQEEGEVKIYALLIQKGLLYISFYQGAMLLISKDYAKCSDPTEAVPMAKITCIAK